MHTRHSSTAMDPVELGVRIHDKALRHDRNIKVFVDVRSFDYPFDKAEVEAEHEDKRQRTDDEDEEDDDDESYKVVPEDELPAMNKVALALRRYHFAQQPFFTGEVNDIPIGVERVRGDFGTLCRPRIKKLSKIAAPAPFGRGSETVYDESVRLAKNIPEYFFTYGFTSELCEALSGCGSVLCGGESASVRFSKVHIYEPNGHFAPHRDTLKNHEHIGTIVLLLGSKFEGGEFMIGGEVCPLKPSAPGKVPFVVFHTDTIHEVRPVISGMRITMQFDVYKGSRPVVYHDDHDPATGPPVSELFVSSDRPVRPREGDDDIRRCQAIADLITPEQLPLIIPTYHRYTQQALHDHDLKPTDMRLYRLLSEKYHITPVPLNIYSTRHCDRGDTRVDHSASLFWQPPFLPQTAKKGTTLLIMPQLGGLRIFSQDECEYTGNEAQPGIYAYYFSGLLITQEAFTGRSDSDSDSEEEAT